MGDVVPIKPKKILTGNFKPRVMSLPLKGKSRGDEFAELAEKCNLPLFPWQRYIADDFLTVDDEDNYIRKSVVVLVSRQNGKTHLIALRIIAELFLWNPKGRVLAMSSERSMAEDTFRQVCEIIEDNDFLRDQVRLNRDRVGYFGNGRWYFYTKQGGKYEVVAATKSGSRGKHADLLFMDELRDITPLAYAAAKPTTISIPNAQTYMTSNAGDAFSEVLNGLRDAAISYPSESLGWYEYSAAPRVKLDDRRAWADANPSLGHTITEAALLEAYSTLDTEKFRTEHLCQWVNSLSSPFPHGAWEACSDKNWTPAPGAYTVFGFDVARSRKTASLVAGQIMPDGRIGIALLDTWNSNIAVDDLKISADIKAWCDKYMPAKVCFDHYSTASIAARLTSSGVICEDVSGQQFYQACGDLLDAMVAMRLVHTGQPEMTAQMDAVAAKENDSSWRIIRRTSAGDVSAPISLAMVVHTLVQPLAEAAIY